MFLTEEAKLLLLLFSINVGLIAALGTMLWFLL